MANTSGSGSRGKSVLAALVALVLAIAVYFGFVSQETADNVQTQADQTLNTGQPEPEAGAETTPDAETPAGETGDAGEVAPQSAEPQPDPTAPQTPPAN